MHRRSREWTPAVADKRSHLFDGAAVDAELYLGRCVEHGPLLLHRRESRRGRDVHVSPARPAKTVRLLVTGASGKVVREVTAPASAGQIHRVNWDLRYPVPPGTGRGGGGGGEEGGGGGGPGTEKPGVIQLPVPSHDIGPRGPHVAPGTFKVTLEIDGVAGESRMFEVRPDPGRR
jgi:hypothetical protein